MTSTTSEFGDSEPEDAWHPDDPLPDLVDNIRRRVILLAASGDRRTWADRDRLRATDIDIDLQYIIDRLRDG